MELDQHCYCMFHESDQGQVNLEYHIAHPVECATPKGDLSGVRTQSMNTHQDIELVRDASPLFTILYGDPQAHPGFLCILFL